MKSIASSIFVGFAFAAIIGVGVIAIAAAFHFTFTLFESFYLWLGIQWRVAGLMAIASSITLVLGVVLSVAAWGNK